MKSWKRSHFATYSQSFTHRRPDQPSSFPTLDSSEERSHPATQMSDRFFPNEMPDYIRESPVVESASSEAAKDSLTKLLQLPYKSVSDTLLRAALDLKETVVRKTLGATGSRVHDYSLYTGALGTAFLLFKAFLVTNNINDLSLCSDIIQACHSSCCGSSRVTFICGQAGVYALGAVAAKHTGDERLREFYLKEFNEIALPNDLPDELLYGRAGFLWACLFLNKNLGKGTVSTDKMRAAAECIIRDGRKLGNEKCPLMYEWHGKKYLGAAHGVVGIMHVLMDMELKSDELEDVKSTLRYMIKNRFTSGNYPSSKGSESDRLVHWCHGAPGVAITLAKAAKVLGAEEFLRAAADAGEVVWSRGLLKRVGLCHGVAGNAYVFLSLYRLTGKGEYLYRAKAFACFLHDRAQALISSGTMHGGDRPFSLFEGLGGMAYLFLDMAEPSKASFPAYEL